MMIRKEVQKLQSCHYRRVGQNVCSLRMLDDSATYSAIKK
jgi:hypothetical protein